MGARMIGIAAALLGSLLAAAAAPAQAAAHKLLVISVDGLDWRYLRDRDAMGLSIPNLRRLMREGEVTQGVIGVWPTITWPSHTSIVTGVRPDQHGILGNAQRGSPLTQSYWQADKLKAPTLWQCARAAGRTTAAITWPVTTDADITWNLPEWFRRRNGGSMDLEAVGARATPGLVQAISRAYPSFPQQWVDDRTRTLATLYLLREKQPDLILLHLVDLDSDQHDRGPFEGEAKATLERSDELIGSLLAALPPGYDLVVTSDHGFERIDRVANLQVRAAAEGVSGGLRALGGVAVADTPAAAAFLRKLAAQPGQGVGREIPKPELAQYAPDLAAAQAVFEPEEHVMFGRAATGDEFTTPEEKGEHGLWPTHVDYRSVFLAWGPGVGAGAKPEAQMIDLNRRLQAILDLDCRGGQRAVAPPS